MTHAQLQQFFPSITASQHKQLCRYADLLREWNARVNLVSRKDTANLWEHHLLHGLAPLHVLNLPAGARVLDIGCGGGIPGIPLAIARPEVHFTLTDSILKKVTAVSDMIAQLALPNAHALRVRVEDLPERFDAVVGRAVTRVDGFWRLARPLLKPGGAVFYLAGGELDEFIAGINAQVRVYPLAEHLPLPHYATKHLVYLK